MKNSVKVLDIIVALNQIRFTDYALAGGECSKDFRLVFSRSLGCQIFVQRFVFVYCFYDVIPTCGLASQEINRVLCEIIGKNN